MATRVPPRLGVTLGCPAGIGPEVVARALTMVHTAGRWAIFGAPHAWARAVKLAGAPLTWATCSVDGIASCASTLCLVPSAEPGERFTPGVPDDRADAAAAAALRDALQAARAGAVAAVATGPVRKRCFSLLEGGPFPGHTELFHHALGTSPAPVMLFVAPGMRLALHTIHVPLAEVAAAVTASSLGQTLDTLAQGLGEDMGIADPIVHVLALNPHASEGGLIGREDLDAVAPAVRAAAERGIRALGPFPADGYFGRYRDSPAPDAVLALYHDQGLAPFKLWEHGRGCQTTLRLRVPRTSCDHGTAYGLAGRGGADARSMAAAMRLAATVARRRARPV